MAARMPAERELKIVTMYQQGAPWLDIRKATNTSEGTIMSVLKRNRVVLRTTGKRSTSGQTPVDRKAAQRELSNTAKATVAELTEPQKRILRTIADNPGSTGHQIVSTADAHMPVGVALASTADLEFLNERRYITWRESSRGRMDNVSLTKRGEEVLGAAYYHIHAGGANKNSRMGAKPGDHTDFRNHDRTAQGGPITRSRTITNEPVAEAPVSLPPGLPQLPVPPRPEPRSTDEIMAARTPGSPILTPELMDAIKRENPEMTEPATCGKSVYKGKCFRPAGHPDVCRSATGQSKNNQPIDKTIEVTPAMLAQSRQISQDREFPLLAELLGRETIILEKVEKLETAIAALDRMDELLIQNLRARQEAFMSEASYTPLEAEYMRFAAERK